MALEKLDVEPEMVAGSFPPRAVVLSGSVWDLLTERDYLVIPTVIGWTRNGEALFDPGLATQAAERYPRLRAYYGEVCRTRGEATPVMQWNRLILLPTKTLSRVAPWRSQRAKPSLALISKGLRQLAEMKIGGPQCDRVLITDVGCEPGGLTHRQIIPRLVQCHHRQPKLTLILPDEAKRFI